MPDHDPHCQCSDCLTFAELYNDELERRTADYNNSEKDDAPEALEDLREIIDDCTDTAISHGFPLDHWVTQFLLIGSEVSELLENVDARDPLMRYHIDNMDNAGFMVEHARKKKRYESMEWWVRDGGSVENIVEELADICIRVFSFVGGNRMTKAFIVALNKKMDFNKSRPFKHGKEF